METIASSCEKLRAVSVSRGGIGGSALAGVPAPRLRCVFADSCKYVYVVIWLLRKRNDMMTRWHNDIMTSWHDGMTALLHDGMMAWWNDGMMIWWTTSKKFKYFQNNYCIGFCLHKDFKRLIVSVGARWMKIAIFKWIISLHGNKTFYSYVHKFDNFMIDSDYAWVNKQRWINFCIENISRFYN